MNAKQFRVNLVFCVSVLVLARTYITLHSSQNGEEKFKPDCSKVCRHKNQSSPLPIVRIALHA